MHVVQHNDAFLLLAIMPPQNSSFQLVALKHNKDDIYQFTRCKMVIIRDDSIVYAGYGDIAGMVVFAFLQWLQVRLCFVKGTYILAYWDLSEMACSTSRRNKKFWRRDEASEVDNQGFCNKEKGLYVEYDRSMVFQVYTSLCLKGTCKDIIVDIQEKYIQFCFMDLCDFVSLSCSHSAICITFGIV
ncbi:hypothetical protein GUJ93_ZPchr0001g30315 [Zizania palustris]|uniref:Uncharacterized protein n=1 Tax=Zizania palustris TaxID=103762 RepID=A0A8J5RFB0_ZIZPA|nr:hypothetical protein GUJ93_ZPchr0001g30315 [Zizania palustris]